MNETLFSEDQPKKLTYEQLLAKYKDNEGIVNKIEHSEAHIKKIETENEEFRNYALRLKEDAQSRAKLEELIDQLSTLPQQTTRDAQPQSTEVKKPEYDPNQLDSLVSSKIQQYEQQKKQDANWTQVKDRLRAQYGDSYNTVLREQMDNLGLSEDDINVLARKSPSAFFRTLGLDQQQGQSFQTPPRTAQQGSFKPTTHKRTWTYWQKEMRDPEFHSDPRRIEMMMKDAEELGTEFEDGDFHTDKFLYRKK